MNIIERIKKRLGINSPEILAEGIVTSFNERKENGEKNPIDNTVKEIMEIIKQNQDLEVTEKLLTKILEKKEISDRVAFNAFKEISKDNEIPDKIITNVVEQANTQVPDELIEELIKEGDVNPNVRIQLIQNVEDPEIVKRRIKNELKILYNNCKGKQDREIVERLQEIESVLEKEDINGEIQDLFYEVVSKKMAENYYDDKLRATKIYEFSSIIPFEEMIENGLPDMVEKEYIMLEEKGEEKTDRFSKTKLTQLILDKMANDIVRKYKEIGILAIPQSENMKKLSSEEERSFIKAIQNFCGEALSKDDIMDIHEQIKGNVASNKIKEDILIKKIQKMPDSKKSEYIDLLIAITGNDETLKTLRIMQNSEMIDKLNSIPEAKREKRIEAIGDVLEKRKIATQSIKMDGNPQVDVYIEDDSDQR